MNTQYIQSGDYVQDPLDDGAFRQVDHVEGNTVYMTDGGFMGADEIERVWLESEIQ